MIYWYFLLKKDFRAPNFPLPLKGTLKVFENGTYTDIFDLIYRKGEINSKFTDYYTKTEINDMFANIDSYTKTESDNRYASSSHTHTVHVVGDTQDTNSHHHTYDHTHGTSTPR